VKPGPTVPISFVARAVLVDTDAASREFTEAAEAGTSTTSAARKSEAARTLPTPGLRSQPPAGFRVTAISAGVGAGGSKCPAPTCRRRYWFAARGVAVAITKSAELTFVSFPSGDLEALFAGLSSEGGAATGDPSTRAFVAVP
jgi:hypothetical protein